MAQSQQHFRDYLIGMLGRFRRAARGPCAALKVVADQPDLCPSCNARHMAETGAHLVDQVYPPLRVRQWVLSVPKRLRWYLEREPRAVNAVLHLVLRVIEGYLCQASGASPHARLGG